MSFFTLNQPRYTPLSLLLVSSLSHLLSGYLVGVRQVFVNVLLVSEWLVIALIDTFIVHTARKDEWVQVQRATTTKTQTMTNNIGISIITVRAEVSPRHIQTNTKHNHTTFGVGQGCMPAACVRFYLFFPCFDRENIFVEINDLLLSVGVFLLGGIECVGLSTAGVQMLNKRRAKKIKNVNGWVERFDWTQMICKTIESNLKMWFLLRSTLGGTENARRIFVSLHHVENRCECMIFNHIVGEKRNKCNGTNSNIKLTLCVFYFLFLPHWHTNRGNATFEKIKFLRHSVHFNLVSHPFSVSEWMVLIFRMPADDNKKLLLRNYVSDECSVLMLIVESNAVG